MQLNIEVIKRKQEDFAQQVGQFARLASELEAISSSMTQETLWPVKRQLEQEKHRLKEQKVVLKQILQALDQIIRRYEHSEQRIIDDYSGDRIVWSFRHEQGMQLVMVDIEPELISFPCNIFVSEGEEYKL